MISTAAIELPPSSYGGIEAIVDLLGDGLIKRGHDVAIAAPKGSKPTNPNIKLIETVDLKSQAYQENTALQFYSNEIKDFDVVNDHTHSKFAAAFIKQNDINVTYVPTVHNMSTIAYPIRKPSIVTLSKAHAKWIEGNFGYKCRYVYNGLKVDDFIPVLNKKLKTDRYVAVGRPNPEKNLIEAIDLCKRANVPLDVIAGRLSIEPTDYCVKIAQACTFGSPWRYIGQVSHQEKNSIMSRAKATLITYGGKDSRSYYIEPFGLVAIESLLLGTPVVTYDCGALKELVRDGKDGFVVPRNDQEAFVKAMKEVDALDLPEIRANAMQRWSHERMAEDYEAIYKAKLNGENW